MAVLKQIVESKRKELPELRRRRLPTPPAAVPAVNLNRESGAFLRLICEIKRRSPSAGPLSTQLTVAERARAYQAQGAAMISVLCDGPFFDGSYDHLLDARAGSSLPLLCKEFVLDECQLDAARAYGASAVLLIVRCLENAELERLLRQAVTRGLWPLVEIRNDEECRRALGAGATAVGVNARDLDTLEMDGARADRIVQALPKNVTAVHLSGVRSPEDVAKVAQGRADAVLVGEVLMRQDDPSELLARLVAAGR